MGSVDSCLEIDYIGRGNDLVQDSKWLPVPGCNEGLVNLAAGGFVLPFIQNFDKGFHASGTQRFDEFVSRCFVRFC
jgi:hypothetical protein